jgi:hypothetical protein
MSKTENGKATHTVLCYLRIKTAALSNIDAVVREEDDNADPQCRPALREVCDQMRECVSA